MQRTPSAPLMRQPLGGGTVTRANPQGAQLVLAMALLVGGLRPLPVAAETGSRASAVIGCYQLAVGPWQPDVDPRDLQFVVLPKRIRLTTMPSEWDKASFRIQSLPPVPANIRPHSYWHPENGGVFLNWTDGHAGVLMNLKATAEGFTGAASTHWDWTEHVRQTSKVSASRITCPQETDREDH